MFIEVAKDHVLFKAGDVSDCVFIILKGSVDILLPKEKTPTVTLKKGHLFGELGVINNTTRAGTAIIREPAYLLRVNAKRFKEIYASSPKLQKILQSLKKTYLLPTRGSVEQFFGKIMGMQSITTIYKLNDGRTVIASHTLEKSFFVMSEENVKHAQLYKYEKNAGTTIELQVLNDYIVSIKCDDVGYNLSQLCAAQLDRQKIPKHVFDHFRSTGEFRLDIPPQDFIQADFVCTCMCVKRVTIEGLIKEGLNSLAMISNKTGACTVCGTCRVRILEMLGQSTWLSAMMEIGTRHKNNVISYYIRATSGIFKPFVPGEHIVLQICIDKNWLERAYTLSNLSEDGKLRITIKMEETGLFTKWLFNNSLSPLSIYCSQPQGNFTLNLNSTKPILCIAGGIGITPFITFAKMLQKQQNQRRMHLIYIAPTKNDHLFIDEFTDITNTTPSITITLWEKRISGVLPEEKISEAIKNIDDGEIYICGPEGFETSIVNSLNKLKFDQDKIHIEKFMYANPIQTKED